MQRRERLKPHEEPKHVRAGGVVGAMVERREGHFSHFATHFLFLQVAPLQHCVAHVKRLVGRSTRRKRGKRATG